jgi:hypothetical protein
VAEAIKKGLKAFAEVSHNLAAIEKSLALTAEERGEIYPPLRLVEIQPRPETVE